MKIFKILEDGEIQIGKKVFNNSHNTRAIGCQMKLQYVITLQNSFPQDIKIYKGSEVKWITGIVREVLLCASPALKHFPKHQPKHCYKQDPGLENCLNWAVLGQTITLQLTLQHVGIAFCKGFNSSEALQDTLSSL